MKLLFSIFLTTLLLLKEHNDVNAFSPTIFKSSSRSKISIQTLTLTPTPTASTLTSTSTSTSTSIQSTPVSDEFRIASTLPPSSDLAPLAQHTFAGKVEVALIRKFGEEDGEEAIQRVIDSWRLLDQEYEHREFFGEDGSDPDVSKQWQNAHSYVPGLSVKPFWDTSDLPWANKLAKSYKQIRKEFTAITSDMEKLQQDGNNIWAGALTEEAGGYGEGWSTLVLKDRGIWDEVNCNLFPKTAKLVEKSGIPATEVFFAAMKPQSDIKLHSDNTNFVLTSHLGLVIPSSGENKCRLSIGDETREWIDGEVMVFDTSIMHDACNESEEMRYILMFRVWHPDLSEVEREALQFIYDSLSVPELLDNDPVVRQAAEEHIKAMRNFPTLKSATGGFGGGGGKSGAKAASKKKKKKR